MQHDQLGAQLVLLADERALAKRTVCIHAHRLGSTTQCCRFVADDRVRTPLLTATGAAKPTQSATPRSSSQSRAQRRLFATDVSLMSFLRPVPSVWESKTRALSTKRDVASRARSPVVLSNSPNRINSKPNVSVMFVSLALASQQIDRKERGQCHLSY